MRRAEATDLYVPISESDLRAKVVDAAHARGWLVFSLPIARTRRPVKDATGYPDLTLARDGEVMWIELKAQDGKLSPSQTVWQHALPFAHHVIRPSDWYSGRVGEILA